MELLIKYGLIKTKDEMESNIIQSWILFTFQSTKLQMASTKVQTISNVSLCSVLINPYTVEFKYELWSPQGQQYYQNYNRITQRNKRIVFHHLYFYNTFV